jgi:hypothetical protein
MKDASALRKVEIGVAGHAEQNTLVLFQEDK